jgi:hypothetical protein
MMICPVCRSQNLETAKYCGNCGHAFTRSPLLKCANEHIYSAVYSSCPYCPPVGAESAYATSKSPAQTGNLTGPLDASLNGGGNFWAAERERPVNGTRDPVIRARAIEDRAEENVEKPAEMAVTILEEKEPWTERRSEATRETPVAGLEGFGEQEADVAEVPVSAPETQSSRSDEATVVVEPALPREREMNEERRPMPSVTEIESPPPVPIRAAPMPSESREEAIPAYPVIPQGRTVGRDENGTRSRRPPVAEAERKTIIAPDALLQKQGSRGKLVGWLISYSANPDGQDFRLYAGYNRLGANPVCDIVIDDDTVSGSHAILVYREGRCLIKDDLSRNGTFVNGREITEAHPLQNYDQIRVGNTHLTFVAAQRV